MTRRPAALRLAALCGVLLLGPLAACADKDVASDPGDASTEAASAATGELSEVSFEGEVGEGITATWNDAIAAPDELEVTTLVAGDGEPVEEGDTVMVYLWVANGTSKEQVFSDYDNGAPEAIPYDPAQIDEVFGGLFADQTYGSRVVAVATPEMVFPGQAEGNPLGVAPEDTLVIVADLIEKQAVAPEPTSDQPEEADPASQPKVVEEGGLPVGLDFEGLEEPELDTPVQVQVITEGDGAPVKATDTVTVNYLGSVFDADAPFDESFSRGEPLVSSLSGLIQGWSIGLADIPVGSRVLLQIPPAYGYGAQGSPPNIPGNATLWFLIDIIKAEKG